VKPSTAMAMGNPSFPLCRCIITSLMRATLASP
jgi:hypothetical protein